jgi:hypothetical protein
MSFAVPTPVTYVARDFETCCKEAIRRRSTSVLEGFCRSKQQAPAFEGLDASATNDSVSHTLWFPGGCR